MIAGFGQRKVHARTGCDARSDCANGKDNVRYMGAYNGGARPKSQDMAAHLKVPQ